MKTLFIIGIDSFAPGLDLDHAEERAAAFADRLRRELAKPHPVILVPRGVRMATQAVFDGSEGRPGRIADDDGCDCCGGGDE